MASTSSQCLNILPYYLFPYCLWLHVSKTWADRKYPNFFMIDRSNCKLIVLEIYREPLSDFDILCLRSVKWATAWSGCDRRMKCFEFHHSSAVTLLYCCSGALFYFFFLTFLFYPRLILPPLPSELPSFLPWFYSSKILSLWNKSLTILNHETRIHHEYHETVFMINDETWSWKPLNPIIHLFPAHFPLTVL